MRMWEKCGVQCGGGGGSELKVEIYLKAHVIK